MTNGLAVASGRVTSRGPARSRTIGLVAFLFGTAAADELPGLALVRLLGDLGIGEVAARGLLARMRHDGQIRAVRHGREVGYRLDGPLAAAFRRLRSPSPPPAWDGHFHALLHHVPEEHRGYRDRLRRMATFAGYGVMQPGVLVAVRDPSAAVAPVLADAPAGCRIHHATLAVDTADAARIAIDAWDLDDLATRLREHVSTMSAALAQEGRPPTSAAALRRFVELRNAPLVDLVADPGLPVALLPPDWPGGELARLMGQVQDRYGSVAAQYVRGVLAEVRRRPAGSGAPGPGP